MFKPDKLLVTGEIQVKLTNGHTVPGQIVMTENGEVSLKFTDPSMVGMWLRTALDQNLIGLQIVTLTEAPMAGFRPTFVSKDRDYLQETDEGTVWYHNCDMEGFITLPADRRTCPHCGVIQITRKPA